MSRKMVCSFLLALAVWLLVPSFSEARCGRLRGRFANRPHRVRTWFQNRPHRFFHRGGCR